MLAPRHSDWYGTGDWRDKVRKRKPLTPRMRQALRLYHSGLVPTKGAAADAVGLNRQTFYSATMPIVGDAQVGRLVGEVDLMVENATINTRALVEQLSRKAIGVIGKVMLHGDKEENRLKAAVDLADRGSETSKIQKHQIESWSLGSQDAKSLADALVEAARVKQLNAVVATQDYIRLEGGSDGKGRNERDERQEEGHGSREGSSDAEVVQG